MEDRQIVNLYFLRDESAIRETKTKYGAYILKIALNVLGSAPDADECENDTYLAAWNTMPPKRPNVLRAYLGRIARNLAINIYRKNRAEKRGGSMDDLLCELDECAPTLSGDLSLCSPDTEFDLGELTRIINDFLRSQPESKRVIFVKRYWYGESVADISKTLGISQSKAATTLFRMRESLKTALLKEGIEV